MQAIDLPAGRYRYVSHLHSGSESEVFCARVDGVFGFEKLVAVKRLPLPRPARDEARARLIRHAVICSKLSHHNIVGVYDFYQDEHGLCLAMEMIEGASLASIIARQRESKQPVAISTILSVASQLLEVLSYIHKARDPLTRKPLGLVHRDLNPHSIMVDRTGVVKLLGFGRAQSALLPDTVPLWDSPYMAPELSEGMTAGPSADVFSVGAVLYEMMTLKPLFSGRAARRGRRARLEVEAMVELLPRAYQALRPVLLRAVALSPAERYSSAARMADDLRPFVVPTTRSLPPDLGLRLAATSAMTREGRGRRTERLAEGVEGTRDEGAVVVALRGAEDVSEDERETEVGPVARLAPRGAPRETAPVPEYPIRPEDVPEGEGPVARLASAPGGPGGEDGFSPSTAELRLRSMVEKATVVEAGEEEDEDATDLVEAETLEARGREREDVAESGETLSTVRTVPTGEEGGHEEDSISLVFEEEREDDEGDEEGAIQTRRSSLDELEEISEAVLPRGRPSPASREGGDRGEVTAPSSGRQALVNLAHEYATARTPPPDGVPVSPQDTVEAPYDLPGVASGDAHGAETVSLADEGERSPAGHPAVRPGLAGVREGAGPYKDTLDLPIPTKSGISLLFVSPHPGVKCIVPQTGLTIGRSHANDLVLADYRVAPRHARIMWVAGRWWMKAQAGASLLVDGVKSRDIPLEAGQLIQIGGVRLSVQVEDGPQPGQVLDYNALALHLVARFRHLILDPDFRREVGLELSEQQLAAAPSRVWVSALEVLRADESRQGLERLLDALLERDPGAVSVQRARECLARLDVAAPPVSDEETASLTGR